MQSSVRFSAQLETVHERDVLRCDSTGTLGFKSELITVNYVLQRWNSCPLNRSANVKQLSIAFHFKCIKSLSLFFVFIFHKRIKHTNPVAIVYFQSIPFYSSTQWSIYFSSNATSSFKCNYCLKLDGYTN